MRRRGGSDAGNQGRAYSDSGTRPIRPPRVVGRIPTVWNLAHAPHADSAGDVGDGADAAQAWPGPISNGYQEWYPSTAVREDVGPARTGKAWLVRVSRWRWSSALA